MKSGSKHSNTKPWQRIRSIARQLLLRDSGAVFVQLWGVLGNVVSSSSMLWPHFGSRGVNGPDVPVNKEPLARFMLAEAKFGNGSFALLTVSSYKCRNTLIWLARMLLCADCAPNAEGATVTFFCCSSKRRCELRADSLPLQNTAPMLNSRRERGREHVFSPPVRHSLASSINWCESGDGRSQDTFSFS